LSLIRIWAFPERKTYEMKRTEPYCHFAFCDVQSCPGFHIFRAKIRAVTELRKTAMSKDRGQLPKHISIAAAAVALCLVLALMTAAACHTTSPVVPAAPPPAPATPPVQQPSVKFFTAEPDAVTSGQPVVLRWSVANSDTVSIDNGIGEVKPEGSREIRPGDTTTYKLEAKNTAGTTVEAVATVAVSKPLPPSSTVTGRSKGEIVARELQDVYFDYDAGEIRPEQRSVLEKDASVLSRLFTLDPTVMVTIEGHCDERGSSEYNLALGDRRATVVRQTLVNLGLPGEKLVIITYGKEHAICFDETEACYAKNRRAHFSLGQ
jgi:peptidoglycan-associated lipoprotein